MRENEYPHRFWDKSNFSYPSICGYHEENPTPKNFLLNQNFSIVIHSPFSLFCSLCGRFSQTFIDIREKEKKRGPRGLMTLPQRIDKIDEKISPEIANDTEHQHQPLFKPEDIKELQEKIKKEIEESKLQEKEMQELQVRI